MVLQKPSDQTGMDQPINWEHWDHLSSMRLEVLTKMAAGRRLHVWAFLSLERGKMTKGWKKMGTLGGGRRVSVVSFPPNDTLANSNCVTMKENLLQLLFVRSSVFVSWVFYGM